MSQEREDEDVYDGLGDTPQGVNDNNNHTQIIRYGILGCAAIAAKIARAIRLEKTSKVVFVASRDKQKANVFISRNCSDAKACSYDELINSEEVDCVYIPLPTGIRLPWVIKAIEKKKHVICEKPIGSPRYMDLIIPSCDPKQVQFMDGIQFMHHRRFKELTNEIHIKKSIGNIQRVISSFSVPCLDDSNIRNNSELEPLGVLGDLGVYNIRLSLWAFNYDPPRFVKAVCHRRNVKGCLQDCSVWLFFSEDRTASFDCSFVNPLRQHAELVGETKSIFIPQFVIPNEKYCKYEISQCTLNQFDSTEERTSVTFENECQEVSMIHHMNEIIRNKKLERFWPNVTLVTEQILDACRRSINKDGNLVEFQKGQIWFEMKNSSNRRYSVVGSKEHVFGANNNANNKNSNNNANK